MQRVVLLGGESSGKTTLAQALAQAEGTVWVPEYGRERWEQRAGRLTLEDLVDIGRIQIEREQALLSQASRLLVCDTSPLTTLGYAQWMFNAQPPALQEAAQHRYDLVVLCAPDFGFVQDGTRRDAAFQREQQAWDPDDQKRSLPANQDERAAGGIGIVPGLHDLRADEQRNAATKIQS